MPLIVNSLYPFGEQLYLWKVSESVEELARIADLDMETRNEIMAIHHPKRRRELFALQALLKTIEFNPKIRYLSNGKPIVDEHRHISISHAGNIAGFLISPSPCGLDIQDKNEKIRTISKRFCSPEEILEAEGSPDPLAYYTILWSVKEAVFKVFGEHVIFAEEIKVLPLHTDMDDSFMAICKRDGKEIFFEVKKEIVGAHYVIFTHLNN